MPENTNEDKMKNKLEYIGLDLNNIPEILKEFEDLKFKVSKTSKDNEYKIYRYIPINKIKILITEKNRLEDLKEKYNDAKPIYKYLNQRSEEDSEYYDTFIEMLKKIDLGKIDEIDKLQTSIEEKIPFSVKYPKSYEWQIYYSEETDTYFMLVTTQEAEYECLFYILKKQIEYSKKKIKKVQNIFVPINHVEYSGDILKKSEILEIENYLWLFTKEWAITYEVTNFNGEKSIHIIGETFLYNGIKTKYKIQLNNREEALEFYKKLKALFVIQTEIPHYYNFKTKINNESQLLFLYGEKNIELSNLLDFVKEEYVKVEEIIIENKKILKEKKNELEEIKEYNTKKEKEYLIKQKQIATYLQCKKTFLGKVKYYFKLKKGNFTYIESEEVEENKEENKNNVETLNNKKEYYSIEDLVIIYALLEKQTKEINTLELDIIAAKDKKKLISKKVENANLYITEIDNHKKSIFEFWKFATKDELNALEEGQEKEKTENKKLERVFDYATDMEELGLQADKKQREILTKEEQDCAFVANTIVLEAINIIKRQIEKKEYKENDDTKLENILNQIKSELNSDMKIYSTQNFNIFGSITEENNNIKTLGNKKHREVEKNIFNILEINSKTSLYEFKDIIKKIYYVLEESMKKTEAIYNMDVYVRSN